MYAVYPKGVSSFNIVNFGGTDSCGRCAAAQVLGKITNRTSLSYTTESSNIAGKTQIFLIKTS